MFYLNAAKNLFSFINFVKKKSLKKIKINWKIIDLLDKFFNQKKIFFSKFLLKNKKLMFLSLWRCRCWENYDL